MLTLRTVWLVAVLSLVSLLGCSSGNSSSDDGGGGTDGAALSEGGLNGTASCGETLTCIATCANGDNACLDACYAAASPNGQQLLLALVNCINANNCQDATCTTTNCSTQLNACTQDAPVVTDAGSPTGTQGTPLPSSLVGTWQWVTTYGGTSHTFAADGTWSSVYLYQASGGCITIAKLTSSIDGVAQLSGSTLTLVRLSGTVTNTDCSNTVTTKPANLGATAYSWSLSPDGLTLTLNDGTSSVDYAKQ